MSAPFETLRRDLLLAVELIDPATLAPVYQGVTLRALGLTRAPLLGWSGRFAWLTDGARWPSEFAFEPGAAPYDAQVYPAPPRPPDLARIPPEQRLLRFVLRPSAAYPFGDGLTAVRGRLLDTAQPVAGALVLLEGPGLEGIAASTNAHGEFAACLRHTGPRRPELDNGKLTLRILVKRGAEQRFQVQQLPDGQLFDLPAALDWSALTPV